MRLGSYKAVLKKQTKVHNLYVGARRVTDEVNAYERHRHRYEVNPAYIEILENFGLIFSGFYTREDGTQLMEFAEIADHPFFIATQAHPEFKSRLGSPSPLFFGFVAACKELI